MFRAPSAFLSLLLLTCAGACSRRAPEPPSPTLQVIGRHGGGDGEFVVPRGAAIDGVRGLLYVVDKTGRIQKFDLLGRFLASWTAPGGDKGRPTALAVAPDGRLWVANTHNHEVLAYAPDGTLLFRWGGMGTGPGEFIYPVGILVHPDGSIIVGEYGGNDRIQVFRPDGTPIRSWGGYGAEPGKFKRPQGLALDPAGRLFVADAANHRVQIFSMDGEWLGAWGGLGTEPGRLMYPYGLAFGSDGTLLVCEYGTNRVQRFTPDGRPLGTRGGLGTEPGRLDTPWTLLFGPKERLFVVDRGNHRVQVWPWAMLVR